MQRLTLSPAQSLAMVGYGAAVRAKRLLGLSCARHRSFFLVKLACALDQGKVSGRLDITAAGKRDGAGAQGLARVSALCFARTFGLRYVHSPFITLAHAELPMDQWLEQWESLLGLGDGVQWVADSRLPIVDLEPYAMSPCLWSRDHLLSVRHYHPIFALAPQQCEEVSRALGESFQSRHGASPRARGLPLELRVHVRRGDVHVGDPQTRHRFMSNDRVVRMIDRVRRTIEASGRACHIRLYSQGRPEDFSDFDAVPGIQFRLDLPAIDTFRELVDSDILMLARSDFSYLAGMYCRGLKICDRRHRYPLPGWIPMDPDTGWLDERSLALQLSAR